MTKAIQYLGSPQVAIRLGCSLRTVHRLVGEKRLTPAMVTPGGPYGAFLFRAKDVERLAAQLAQKRATKVARAARGTRGAGVSW